MRALIVGLTLCALGAPARAQAPSPELEVLRAQQADAQRRAIDQENQQRALDARLRADSAAALTERAVVRLPAPPYAPAVTTSAAQSPRSYPSVSDATLADSNRRVQEAARPRR